MPRPFRIKRSQYFPESADQVVVNRQAVQAPMASHGHEFWEIVFILSGTGVHRTGDTRHRLRPGDVMVISSQRSHGYEDTDRLGLVNVLLRSDVLVDAAAQFGGLPGFHALFTLEPARWRRREFTARLHLNSADLRRTVAWIDTIAEEAGRRAEGGSSLARNWLMILIGFLARKHAERDVLGEADDWRLARLLSRIDSEPAEKFSIRAMAREVAMSERSFQRHFRETTGFPPLDYVIRSRVRYARALLESEPRTSVTEIAFRCGFNDSNYFARQFRRVMGSAPRRGRWMGPGSSKIKAQAES